MNCPTCKQEIKDRRSLNQNSYWWVCMTIIGNELGYTPQEISVLIKDNFHWYSQVVNKKTGEILKDYESSSSWSKHQFAINTELLIQFAGEHGIRIQTPEEFFSQEL